MPRPHHIQPDPDPDGCWPSCDQEPPGVSIRPLSQTDLQALLAHLTHDYDHDQDEQPGQDQGEDFRAGRPPAGGPVVAMQVRASVGRPGASAQATYRRRRSTEVAAWRRSLPWRAAAVLIAGVAAMLLGSELAPHLTPLAVVAAAAALTWQLRFRPGPDTQAWRRGAKGERRTARLLAPLERCGWAVLHDLAIPGSTANIDHLVIGPGGVVVIDTKQYRGAAAAGRLRDALARPPPARLDPAQDPLGGRPSRRDPRHRRRPDPGHHRRARRQHPLGPGPC